MLLQRIRQATSIILDRFVITAFYLTPSDVKYYQYDCTNLLFEVIDASISNYENYLNIVCGDFNNLHLDFFMSMYHFQSLVKENTRDSSILDHILIDNELTNFYTEAIVSPPIGQSDHNAIYIIPV